MFEHGTCYAYYRETGKGCQEILGSNFDLWWRYKDFVNLYQVHVSWF